MKATRDNFATFGLHPDVMRGVTQMGFTEPTPIQQEAIPPLMAGHDVIGRARTGSGKTAAFGLPLLNRVRKGGAVRALILAPTRELAVQVTEALTELSKGLPIKLVTVYGGASYQTQLRALKYGATVVVGTPGRVIDLMERGALELGAVEMFVLDEADEMLRMGFIEDVEKVLAALPEERQIALFSATMPEPIRRVAQTYLREPVELQVETSNLSVGHIEQKFVQVPPRGKEQALLRLLAGSRSAGTLVFARTRARCAEVAELLIANGISADALHGDLNQGARERVLARLRAKALDVVVATDVAARGLDVEHLSHVINLDMPQDTETYVHRIGRTARAGREGTAISLVTPREARLRRDIERELKVRMEEIRVPTDEQIGSARREELLELIAEELKNPELVDLRSWLRGVLKAQGWSAEDVASAALHLLMKELNFELAAEPVSATPESYPEINEVELVVSLGRRDGIRPADIVGTFTNDYGIPPQNIGRISLGSRQAFVGLPAKVAQLLLETHPTISLRGQSARLRLNDASRAPSSAERKSPSQRAKPKSAAPAPAPAKGRKPSKQKAAKSSKNKGKRRKDG